MIKYIVLLLVFTTAVVIAASEVTVASFSPTVGRPDGGETITIHGCGFREYAGALCLFGPFSSTHATIVSDKEIHCETPNFIEANYYGAYFANFPATVDLTVKYDGDSTLDDTLPNFHIGPLITSMTPTRGPTAGGGSVTITGMGFSGLGSVLVKFDGVSGGSSTVVSSTQITATIPPGDFNAQRMVTLHFSSGGPWSTYYDLESMVYTYGPYVSSLSCNSFVEGGNTITITGNYFGDFNSANIRVNFTKTVTMTAMEPITQLATFLSATQIHVVAPSIAPIGSAGDYGAAIGMVIWGAENDEIAYNEATGAGKDPTIATVAKPRIDSVNPISPTHGWLGGNNSFTIHGCGFSEFVNTDIEVSIDSSPVCTGATITSFTDSTIVCKVPTSGHNCESNPSVEVNFNYPPGSDHLEPAGNYAFGPVIDKSTITATRGKANGGDTFTISGSFFDYRPEPLTAFSEYHCVFDVPAGEQLVNATRVGDTLACTTHDEGFATGGDGVSAAIIFRFGTAVNTNDEMACSIPTATVDRPTWLWYPVCDSIFPTYGALDAGTVVTVTGEGWNDYKWPEETMPPNVALAVIFTATNPPALDTTTWEQLGTDLNVVSDTTFTVTTPVNRYTDRGGNRRFGSTGVMSVYLNSSDALNGMNLTHVVACGVNTFRYGPIVTGVTPQKGPIGPAGATSPNTAVTVSGLGFGEFSGKSSAVLFGIIEQGSSPFSGSSVAVQTRWADFHYSDERGAFKTDSNTNQDVSVYFDTCNKTTTNIEFSWGPSITGVANRWGYHPNGGIFLVINGVGFAEFDIASDLAKVWVGDVECTSVNIASDTSIVCTTPALEFGTNATVRVSFGTTCGLESINYDVSRTIQTESIYYMPRITEINPTLGKVSGGDVITCTGEGFDNYGSTSRVYVADHLAPYNGGSSIGMSPTEFQIVTPRYGTRLPQGRGVWDLDQPISVALDNNDDWRIWFANFHYGPVCSGLVLDGGSRTHGKIGGGETFVINGGNFNDEQTFDYGNTVVSVGTPSVATPTTHTLANGIQFITPSAACGTTQAVKVSFQGPGQSIMEMTCPGFFYGPVIPTQTLSNQMCTGATSRGWTGDTFPVTGELLNDGSYLGTLAATVGGLSSTVTGTTDTGFTFEVPANVAWGQTHSVSISWTGCPSIVIGSIKAYPQVNSINPTVGKVGGGTGVTIQGAFFDCFGFNITDPNDSAVQWGTGAQINATSATIPTEIVTDSPVGPLFTSDIITVWFNRTGTAVSRNVDDSGAQIDFWYGPYVVSMNPTSGKLLGNQSFTISGLNMDDPFFNTTAGCTFSGERVDSMSPPTANEITCLTPEYMGDCMTTPGKTIQAHWFEAAGGAQRMSVQTLPTFELGPQIFSINTQRTATNGAGTVVVTGLNFDDFRKDPAFPLTARCIFGNVYSPTNVISSDTSFSCSPPRGAFGKSGMFGMIFDGQTDAMTTLTAAWHWHAYSDNSLSNNVIDYFGFETVYASGGGFCGYDWAAADVAGKAPFESSVISNWQASLTTSPVGSAGVVTVSFCDDGVTDCSCEYFGSPDALAFGAISIVNAPPPPPTTTVTSSPPSTVSTTVSTTSSPPTTVTGSPTTVSSTGSTVSTTVSTTATTVSTTNGTTTNGTATVSSTVSTTGTTVSTTVSTTASATGTTVSTVTGTTTATTTTTGSTTDDATNLSVSVITIVVMAIAMIFTQ